MNSDRSEAESYFSLFSSPVPLPQKEKIKIKNYLCSTWFERKSKSYIICTAADILKLAFLRCDIIIKVDYICPKESDFFSSQRQSLKGSYTPAPDLSSSKKKKASTQSTTSSQIPSLSATQEVQMLSIHKGKKETWLMLL